MINIPVGLQVYTIRDELSKDYSAALEKVRQIGYEIIEIGGFGPYTTKEWNDLQKNLGLSILSNHIPIELLEESFNHIAEFNLAIGNKNIIVPYMREERRQDADGYKRVANLLNQIGYKFKQIGMKLHYHNHAFEFNRFDGKCGLDILLANTDPQFVMFELDTYWIKFGGEDPLDYIKRFKGRCEILHLKDMSADEKPTYAEVGEGILDFGSIFNISASSGVRYFVVEQDICKRPSLESVRISYENIMKIEHSERRQL